MSDQTLDSIGKLLTGGEKRDAVHFAVAPVIAGGFLKAGERVNFAPGSTELVVAWQYEGDWVGIIDPFLDWYVSEGKRCWLFLRPGTITGLRHEWTHPAFEVQPQPAPAPVDARSESEKWLRGFAQRYEGDYNAMIEAALTDGDYCFGSDIEYPDFGPKGEFWRHVEVVTGRTLTEAHRKQANRFHCAC